MKISCAPNSMAQVFQEEPEFNMRAFIEYCAELGLDGIDVMDTVRYPWQWTDVKTELREIPKMAADNGLEIAAYACANDFSRKADADFQQQVEYVKQTLREAACVGAPLIRVCGGRREGQPKAELPYPQAIDRVLQAIELCLPEAEKCGVVLAMENHGCLPGHGWELKNLVKHFSSPWFKVTFDCANFLANNMDELEDPLHAFDELKDDVVHVHYKDFIFETSPGEERNVQACVAGKGIIPLRQLAYGFVADGYDGFYSLEYEASPFTPAREGVPASIEYIKSVRKVINMLEVSQPTCKA